ncbi:insulin-degrading enzyme-like [Haliotis cracherodii]|uniref:insulin-degrading enzyme-like n=1 Tax=Haliotis cracherodii TaxID=6455 RepID=UPI0039E82639
MRIRKLFLQSVGLFHYKSSGPVVRFLSVSTSRNQKHRLRSPFIMATESIKQVWENGDILRSAQDKRLYRGLELTNGMKLLLISDSDTDKSAAAMNVNIGHMSDPTDLPGLAHFCEHMLFLGTEKYPDENEYSKFLNEHGGSSNAYTSTENTNYFFDITPGNLAGALDRFAQFFLCPLFTSSATDREVNAVNSENDKNLQSDQWRLMQLEKSLADPSHDFSKFGSGNKQTLDTLPRERGQNTRDELLKFHSKYYSANVMGLCVLGKESLDELSEMVVPLFAGVENKSVSVPEWNIHPFGPDQLQRNVCVVPVKDLRQMNVSWSLPDLHPYYTSKPEHYLGHLIGHEGPGSLLSELKARGWVNTLVGGGSPGAKGFGFFIVNVDLTEEGMDHTEDIITLIYQYINMLKAEGVKEWIFKECQDLSAMAFRFKDKERPRGYVSSLSGMIHDYVMPEVLSGSYTVTEYKPDLVQMVIDKLVPENMKCIIIAQKFKGTTDKKEKWYGTDYMESSIPPEMIRKWSDCGLHDNLRLPQRNEFIPTNFDIVTREPESSSAPDIIRDDAMCRFWFKQDDEFLLPKACMTFEIKSSYAYIDPLHANMNSLLMLLFKDALNEYAYDAELAGLGYNLDNTMYGMTLSVKGYNDKLHVLLQKIIERFTTYKVDPKRYEIIKELYYRGLKNFVAEQPHQHAIYFTSVLVSEMVWTKCELLESLDDVTLERLQAFIPQLLSKVYVEGLMYGNITKQRALEIGTLIETILREKSGSKPLLPSQHKRTRELQLPDGCYYMYEQTNTVHSGSCIEIYYQCGRQDTNLNMQLELFSQIISEPCFNILRTQEQLGYIVFSGLRRSSGVQGLRVIVQSDRQPSFVESRVEAFLKTIDDYINKMSEEEFDKHVKALAAKRLEKPKKLSVLNGKYWGEIISEQYHFDRDNVEVAYLKTISKEDLYTFYKSYIDADAPRRHKLSVHIISSNPGDKMNGDQTTAQQVSGRTDGPEEEVIITGPTATVVKDVWDFKRNLALYPLAQPYMDCSKARSKL